MEQYISKSALVAEIKHRKQDAINNCGGFKSMREHECDSCIVEQYEEMKNIIDTLEVKGVDLEKELDSFAYSLPHSAMGSGSRLRHFDDPRVIEARDGGWTHSWKYDEIKKNSQTFL